MPNFGHSWRLAGLLIGAWVGLGLNARAWADGMVVAPRDYKGSLDERSQEAIILFHAGDEKRAANEDLILKIRVEGSTETFAWVIALPDVPTTAPEDAKLFEELHQYVQRQKSFSRSKSVGGVPSEAKKEAPAPAAAVEVISRKDVGSYDVAVVRENKAGALNGWLAENGYRPLDGADDLVDFYRKKGYVFACVRVRKAALTKGTPVDMHPLRFSFSTKGKDGVYFPMRLTGLQTSHFDVNLYVLYGKWLNDRINGFGFAHRGFTLNWRDYDSPACEPNAGKGWSDPASDPYLKHWAYLIPTVTRLCQKLHPGERYYLTNLQAHSLVPHDVRAWPDDLWLFPYYTDAKMIPLDARTGGAAADAYPHASQATAPEVTPGLHSSRTKWRLLWAAVALTVIALGATAAFRSKAGSLDNEKPIDGARLD